MHLASMFSSTLWTFWYVPCKKLKLVVSIHYILMQFSIWNFGLAFVLFFVFLIIVSAQSFEVITVLRVVFINAISLSLWLHLFYTLLKSNIIEFCLCYTVGFILNSVQLWTSFLLSCNWIQSFVRYICPDFWSNFFW